MSLSIFTLRPTWEPIEPFTRALNKPEERRKLKDGEREYDVCADYVHIVEYNGFPPELVKLSINDIQLLKNDPVGFRDTDIKKEKCFLWIIDEQEKLKIAKEKLSNVKRTHYPDFICHTNLSGAQKAFIGGEMFFADDDNVYVNFYSDRYGGPNTPSELWETSKNIFIQLGYVNLVDFKEL